MLVDCTLRCRQNHHPTQAEQKWEPAGSSHKRSKMRHNPAKQAVGDGNNQLEAAPTETCSSVDLDWPLGKPVLFFCQEAVKNMLRACPASEQGEPKLLPLPLSTGDPGSSAHIYLAGEMPTKRTSQNREANKEKRNLKPEKSVFTTMYTKSGFIRG